VSLAEILGELRKIRGKYLKDEGIYVFAKPNIYVATYNVSVGEIESEVIDFTNYTGAKIFFFYNRQDKPVYVNIYNSYAPEGKYYKLRENDIEVLPEEMKVAIATNQTPLLYVKLKMYTLEPSTGNFDIVIARWSL